MFLHEGSDNTVQSIDAHHLWNQIQVEYIIINEKDACNQDEHPGDLPGQRCFQLRAINETVVRKPLIKLNQGAEGSAQHRLALVSIDETIKFSLRVADTKQGNDT